MNRAITMIVCLLVAAGCQQKPPAKSYGEPMKLPNARPVPVATVLGHPDDYNGRYVRVTGTVTSVCQGMGCWLEMTGPENQLLFVKFTCPVEGRLLPLDSVGKTVICEGTLRVTEVSEDDARHVAGEKGMSGEEIEKIVGPQKRIVLQSPAAELLGG